MSENNEDESFIILSMPSLENYTQSTSIDETIDKCTPGKKELDNLTADICLQFPSLSSSSSIETEEKIKLQSIVQEYMELNDTLRKRNVTMREHITALQKSKDKVKMQNEIRAKQFNEFQETIVKLRNENLELQKELEHKIEEININEKNIREENRKMTKMLSDKTSQIQNMAVQIGKLEQQRLENEKVNKKAIKHEYVPILEHKRIVKDLEEKLSENVVKNLELDEMIQANSKVVKKLKDYIEKNEIENAKEKESTKLKIEREYVPILEQRRIVKDLEEKLSKNVEVIQEYWNEVQKLNDYIEKN